MKDGCVSQVVDSPIEKHFLDGWIANHLGASVTRYDGHDQPHKSQIHIDLPLEWFDIFTQRQIGPHRVDFLVIHSSGRRVVVECDGHEFHEKTKEQASRDKQRDRELMLNRYVVMRFTGSELYRDPRKCAHEVEMFLTAVGVI